jgi:hypothetical protein
VATLSNISVVHISVAHISVAHISVAHISVAHISVVHISRSAGHSLMIGHILLVKANDC